MSEMVDVVSSHRPVRGGWCGFKLSHRIAQFIPIRYRAKSPYSLSIGHEANLVLAIAIVEASHLHGTVIEGKLRGEGDIAEGIAIRWPGIGEFKDAIDRNLRRMASPGSSRSMAGHSSRAESGSEFQSVASSYRHLPNNDSDALAIRQRGTSPHQFHVQIKFSDRSCGSLATFFVRTSAEARDLPVDSNPKQVSRSTRSGYAHWQLGARRASVRQDRGAEIWKRENAN